MIRRTKILLLIAAISIILVGCGEKSTKATSTSDTITDNQVTVTTEAEDDLKILHFGLASELSNPTGILGLADTQGYLAEELAAVGYKVEVVGFAQAGPAVNEAFVSKALDMALYGDLPPVVLRSKGIGVNLVGVSNSQTNYNIIVPKDSDISEPKDLEGKKVIVGIGTVAQHYWELYVKEYKIDESKVEIVNDAATASSTFVSGNADAFVTGDLTVEKINAKFPVKILSLGTEHPEWGYQGSIVTRTEFGKEHPEVVTAVLKAYIRAYNDAKADKNLLYQAFVQDGVDIELATKVYSDDDISLFDGDIVEDNVNKVESLNDFLFNANLIAKKIDVNEYIDTSYYETAKKALGE